MIDYDAHDWRSHLLDVKGSMLREIASRVLSCVVWTAVVVGAHYYLHTRFGISLAINATGHTLVGVAFGLLLVFRTNSSYDRFWEGRKLWGAIVNESRNLARGVSVYLAAEPALAGQIIRWGAVFPCLAMNHLRGTRGIGPVADQLDPPEVERALAAEHPPLAVACHITGLLAEGHRRGAISDYVMMQLDQNVQLLIDYLGGCERIQKTPLPFAYVVHLRRALIAYCFTLPFALLEPYGWETIPAVLLLAYILFGIEEIGVEIEGPFGIDDNDLPLEQICSTIERNVLAIAETLPGEAVGDQPSAVGMPVT